MNIPDTLDVNVTCPKLIFLSLNYTLRLATGLWMNDHTKINTSTKPFWKDFKN